ncbi:catecholate siderophore receptor Fiu [Pseudoluteimonas lycopersici]|uniref:Catecholate siderophore receptor Fiu n=1 Tax=Pseudoluteimonas lycopersici TaxID=1324796 RepID=A0A516V4M8_9GAMM|nr:catecholate siderophore receptor Fiu [Lysobacter lycopersici]QDQ73473.1 catecholate siderophore receptor Fiu [Lysobacter lycopersici]
MSHIKSRKHGCNPFPIRSPLGIATLLTGSMLALPAAAQVAAPDGASDKARTLDTITVEGVRLKPSASSSKYTQPLQDTPQTIQVISSDLFNAQGATTLTDALRNTPGVGTFYAGENGNTSTGDAIYMRGFDTSNSVFVDGIRDLGSISRDVFNIEQVEVLKGPAGTDTGRSAPTGAINLVSKEARLAEAVSGTISAGTEGQKRGTADWSQMLGETSALRLNAMWQDSDVPGRDHVNNSRWGVAPSLGFGLDTDTRFWIDLLYVKQDNVPDGFVPTIGLPGWEPQAGMENLAGHPVDPENFYGTRADHDNVTAQMATLRFEHDFTGTLRLSNIARWGKTEQDYLLTSFMGTNANTVCADPADLSTCTLARSNPTLKAVENKILTDQLNLRADFATGGVGHNLSAGLEFAREEQFSPTVVVTNGSAWTPANLYDPDWNATGLTWARNGAHSRGETTTASAYLFDTLKFGERFLLTAGLRLDHYTTDYTANAVCTTATPVPRGGVACPTGTANGTIVSTADFSDSDNLLNWKLGAVFKPIEDVSLYADYAISQQPPGGANFQLSDAANSANNTAYDPQEAKTFEVGAKWSLLRDALALDLSLFDTTVSNEVISDGAGGYYQQGEKRVKGVELSAVGNITDDWSVSTGYTHQDAEVSEGPSIASDGSPNLTYTPGDAFTGWTTYRLPFGLTVGGGVRYTEGMHRGTDGAVGTPTFTKSWTVWDAIVSYAVNDSLTLRLNAYNLFDKQYVAAINKSGYRYTPGQPRSFMLSADFRF